MNGNEDIVISNNDIRIPKSKTGSVIMHDGELSLMHKLAEIVTLNGGDILEIGFGMHLSADAIQSNPNIKSHTIIEVHPEQYNRALIWAEDKPNVKILLGDWMELLPISNLKFDGILHDTHLDRNIDKFLEYIKPNCKEETIVGFFWTPLERDIFNAVRHKLREDEWNSLPYNRNSYFKNGDYELKYTTFNGVDFYKKKNIIKLVL